MNVASYLCMMIFPETYPSSLPVMEQFYTLQGEGAFAGHAAYFIRLAGCDVGCVWCDVKESWDVNEQQWMTVNDIVENALQYPGRMVVITGGEPLMYDLSELTKKLSASGFRIHIETSGAYPISGHFDWICVSPKKFKFPLETVCQKADELKVIVYHHSDFQWGEQYAALVPESCKCYLQAEWSKKDKVTDSIIEYIKVHPNWHLSLQTHKYLNIP